MKEIIRINDKYALTYDEFNYIINEVRIVKKKGSVNQGKEALRPIAFCGTLEQLRTYIFEREIKADKLLDELDKIIELKNELRNIDERLLAERVRESKTEED